MLIDWFTVAAQALNFLVLVWLLKRFLYQPVLDAISTREQRIAKQLADAAAQAAAAKSEREQFEHKNAEFDAQRPFCTFDAELTERLPWFSPFDPSNCTTPPPFTVTPAVPATVPLMTTIPLLPAASVPPLTVVPPV